MRVRDIIDAVKHLKRQHTSYEYQDMFTTGPSTYPCSKRERACECGASQFNLKIDELLAMLNELEVRSVESNPSSNPGAEGQ